MRRRLVAAPIAVGAMLVGTLTLVPGVASASDMAVKAGLGLEGTEVAAVSLEDVSEDATKLPPVVTTDAVENALPTETGGPVVPDDVPGEPSEQDVPKEDDAEIDVSEGQGPVEADEPGRPGGDGVAENGEEPSEEADLADDQSLPPADNGCLAPEGETDSVVADEGSSPETPIAEGESNALLDPAQSTESEDELTPEEMEQAQSEVSTLSEDAAEAKAAVEKVATVQTYRLYNPNSGEHFYTLDSYERDHLVSVGWRYEGVGWTTVAKSNTPVYRLYNPNAGDHHYTTSSYERDHLVSVGWRYEGIGWYSDDAEGAPLYREYNPNARAGAHHFTTDIYERLNIISAGWRYEGIAWYALDLGPLPPAGEHSGWVESEGKEFYFDNGSAVTGWRSINGNKYYFDSKGRMTTGLADIGGTIYNFSNNGVPKQGWVKLSGYWYYFNADGSQRHDGWFTDGGKTYYLDPTSGAMATGTRWIDGYLRPFDSSGACLKTGYQTKWGNLMLAARNVTLPGYAQGSYWSYVHPCTIAANATRAQVIEAFINAAYDYQRAGTRWVDNNCGRPGTTVDCSGLVMESLYAVGMDLTGVAGGDFNPYSKYYWNHHFANTWRLNNTFQPISFSQLERGDIVYYSGHVAIYLGGGRILESTPYASNVREASVYSPGAILGCARPFTK